MTWVELKWTSNDSYSQSQLVWHWDVVLVVELQWLSDRFLLLSCRSDVFSFGVILWELMTESIPWNNLNSVQVNSPPTLLFASFENTNAYNKLPTIFELLCNAFPWAEGLLETTSLSPTIEIKFAYRLSSPLSLVGLQITLSMLFLRGTNELFSSKVVGVVGFMDRRLEIPENLDTRVSTIILDCWQRCSFPSRLFYVLIDVCKMNSN